MQNMAIKFLLIPLLGALAVPGRAAELMPVAEQNALVQKHCAVCHTDAARNGGLSLQHFDAADAAPDLAAILLSKLNSGAMGAAGIPVRDKTTEPALKAALAAASSGAKNWTVQRSGNVLTASTLRESPTPHKGAQPEVYRLIATCDTSAHEGRMQLTWSPEPQTGALSATVDQGATAQFRVEGSESMGNGSGLVLKALASRDLDGLPFPAKALSISGLFPGESLEFSFTQFPGEARRQFEGCFARH